MNWINVIAFVNEKLIPTVTKLTTLLPGMLSPIEADATAALAAGLKLVQDLEMDFASLVAAIKPPANPPTA